VDKSNFLQRFGKVFVALGIPACLVFVSIAQREEALARPWDVVEPIVTILSFMITLGLWAAFLTRGKFSKTSFSVVVALMGVGGFFVACSSATLFDKIHLPTEPGSRSSPTRQTRQFRRV